LPAFSQSATVTPSSLSFGNQAHGTASSVQKLTLKNGQKSAITVTSISTNLSDYGETNNLSIYSTDDRLGFLTCDEPCIMHNPTAYRYHPMRRSPGLRQRDVQVLLPLSPRLLLAFTHKRTYPFITPLERKHVDQINRMMAWHAGKEFVSGQGELRDEWFAAPEASPADAWESRPQEETGGSVPEIFEPLEGPEVLGDDERF
jgi:hypothetical protein